MSAGSHYFAVENTSPWNCVIFATFWRLRNLNFSKAAQQLHIAQLPLSRRIAYFEARSCLRHPAIQRVNGCGPLSPLVADWFPV
jgi:hypothetical protein